jgi:hypothetical protein
VLQVDRAGIEPATYRFSDRHRLFASGNQLLTSDNTPDVLASCLALVARTAPDLALVVERWDALPEAVRAGIVAMVRATPVRGKSR